MSTGRKCNAVATVVLLCLSAFSIAMDGQTSAATSQTHRKTAKKPSKKQLAPLPSGPTGPVQQVPLDSMAPVPPQVSYQNSQLTIVAPNSTLSDILRAVRKQTGAEIEVPVAPERVVTHLGPGSARDVIAQLLNGSRFNYVLLGSPEDSASLTRVVLVAKTGQDSKPSNNPNNPQIAEQPGLRPHTGNPGAPLPDADANPAEAPDENTDEAADQAAAEAEQPPPSSDQPAVKTPQQMLQEMQQRQLQLQQQQQPGQPPVPNPGIPPQQPPPPQPQ
jgi:hypothetical protein